MELINEIENGYRLLVFYIEEDNEYLIQVERLLDNAVLEERMPCTFNPVFSMDILDHEMCFVIVDKLMEELE